ncbi:MAG: hypothetical protein KQI35_05790 [Bacteroidetes bacterium]|nr:hypothetical protein [Bacteroidota bacterium]
MKINKENYEIYFLDYFEGRLATEEVAELMVFLESNPQLKDEFDSFEMIFLEADKTISANFQKLKKQDYIPEENIDSWNYEEKMVAYLEGDLNSSEQEEMKNFIDKNPNARLELNLFRKTFLTAGEEVYENKNELKKTGVLLLYGRPLLYAVSAAAAILMLFGLYTLLKPAPDIEVQVPLTEIRLPVLEPGDLLQDQSLPGNLELRSNHIEIAMGREEETIQEELVALAPMKFRDINAILYSGETDSRKLTKVEPLYTTAGLDVTRIDGIEKDKQPAFAVRFLSGLTKKLIGNPNPDKKSLIELSVDGYNMIADRDVEVKKQLDANGNVVAYNVNGETIAFSHRVNKSTAE